MQRSLVACSASVVRPRLHYPPLHTDKQQRIDDASTVNILAITYDLLLPLSFYYRLLHTQVLF